MRRAAGVLSIAGALLAAALPAAHAAVVTCSDYTFVGIRGSGQTAAHAGGYGAEVRQVRDAVVAAGLGGSAFSEVPVDYTAASADLLIPWTTRVVVPRQPAVTVGLTGLSYRRNVERFTASIDSGVVKTRNVLLPAIEACPRTRFVVAGYSQGALVAHRVINELAAASRADRIAAAVLISDPARNANTKANRRGSVASPSSAASTGAGGITQRLPISAFAGVNRPGDIHPAAAPRVYTVCDKADLVCDPNVASLNLSRNGAKVHTTAYTKNDNVRRLGQEIAAALVSGGRLPDGQAGSAPNNIPVAMLGRWVGEAYQPSSRQTWSIDLTIGRAESLRTSAGTIAYPSLSCQGGLTLVGVTPTRLVVNERIDPPTPRCVTHVVLELQTTPAGLSYKARLPHGTEVARTVLTRP